MSYNGEIINILRFCIGGLVLLVGSILDIRTRRIPNRLWLISGLVAALLLLVHLFNIDGGLGTVFMVLPPVFLYYYFYSDVDRGWKLSGKEWGWVVIGVISLAIYIVSVFHFNVAGVDKTLLYLLVATFFLFIINEVLLLLKDRSSRISWLILMFLCFISLFYLSMHDQASHQAGLVFAKVSLNQGFMLSTSILLTIIVIYSLYNAGVVMGGADAKALMFVALLMPAYPVVSALSRDTLFFEKLSAFPFQAYVFPFAIAILINGALLLLLYPLFFLILNVVRKDLSFPKCLFGYRLETSLFRDRFVWLLEREKDGDNKMALRPLGEREEMKQLESFIAGNVKKVWVQPKIPFLVLMTMGYVIAMIQGNMIYVALFFISDVL